MFVFRTFRSRERRVLAIEGREVPRALSERLIKAFDKSQSHLSVGGHGSRNEIEMTRRLPAGTRIEDECGGEAGAE